MSDREKVIKELEHYIILCADVRNLLKEQEPVSSEELKAHYGKMYKCKGCGLEWYQQTQRYCQHCGKAVKWDG